MADGGRQRPLTWKIDFFEKSVERFSSWVQFEDAKAGAVLVFLGLGLTDLLGDANALIHAHRTSGYGTAASICFWIAMGAALIVIVLVTIAVFPHTGQPGESLVFFRDVASNYRKKTLNDSRSRYISAVGTLDDSELESEMASQALILAGVAAMKVDLVKWGFCAAVLFLLAWATARIALGLA